MKLVKKILLLQQQKHNNAINNNTQSGNEKFAASKSRTGATALEMTTTGKIVRRGAT